jgi:hypothetical protein
MVYIFFYTILNTIWFEWFESLSVRVRVIPKQVRLIAKTGNLGSVWTVAGQDWLG